MADKFDKLGSLPVSVKELEQHPNFSRFSPAELKALTGHCALKALPGGKVLFNEGEVGQAMFIVKKGGIKILKMGYLGETVIGEVNVGEFFGEMAVIDGSPRMATARAAVDTELLELSSDAYAKMQQDNPQAAVKIMDLLLRLLTQRLRSVTVKMLKKTTK